MATLRHDILAPAWRRAIRRARCASSAESAKERVLHRLLRWLRCPLQRVLYLLCILNIHCTLEWKLHLLLLLQLLLIPVVDINFG